MGSMARTASYSRFYGEHFLLVLLIPVHLPCSVLSLSHSKNKVKLAFIVYFLAYKLGTEASVQNGQAAFKFTKLELPGAKE